MWLMYALLSAFFAALVPLFTKIGAPKIDSVTGTALRSIIMSLFLITVALTFKRLNFETIYATAHKELLFIALSGIAGALSWLCYFYALKLGNIANVAAIDRLSLVGAAILGVMILGETVTLKGWVGILCMSVGGILLMK